MTAITLSYNSVEMLKEIWGFLLCRVFIFMTLSHYVNHNAQWSVVRISTIIPQEVAYTFARRTSNKCFNKTSFPGGGRAHKQTNK